MPAAKPKPQVFDETELLDDAAGATEELTVPQGGETSAAEGEEQPQPQGGEQPQPEGEQPPKDTRENARIRQLVDRTKAAERERDEMRERWARMDERSKQVREATEDAQRRAAEAERAAQRPDAAVDPVGARQWDLEERVQRAEAANAELRTQFTQARDGFQGNLQQTEFSNWVQWQAQEYARTTPDYFDAARYAAGKRIETWQSLGMPPEVAKDLVEKESILVANVARQYGVNFAPVIYQLAQQWGYHPAGAQNGNGGGAQARPQTGTAAANANRLDQARRGQQVQGLGRAPGTGGEAQTNYRNYSKVQLADMSESEWSRIKADPAAWADLQHAIAREEGVDVADIRRLN